MNAMHYYTKTFSKVRIASPIEPETDRALRAYKRLPPIPDQFQIDNWVRGLKAAAGLPYGVDNLGLAYDVAYLFGVNTRENAKIDFVTGTKRAIEFPGGEHLITFKRDEGFVGNTTTTAIDTGWNVNDLGNKGTPGGHHYHLSNLLSSNVNSTSFWCGTTNFHTIPLQTVSGTQRFRIRSGSNALANFDNDNTRGAYTIKRNLPNQIGYQKNDNEEITASNTGSNYPDINFFILGINDVNTGSPNMMRSGMMTGSFTAGSKDVDGALLALADRNYFLYFGIDLFDTEI